MSEAAGSRPHQLFRNRSVYPAVSVRTCKWIYLVVRFWNTYAGRPRERWEWRFAMWTGVRGVGSTLGWLVGPGSPPPRIDLHLRLAACVRQTAYAKLIMLIELDHGIIWEMRLYETVHTTAPCSSWALDPDLHFYFNWFTISVSRYTLPRPFLIWRWIEQLWLIQFNGHFILRIQ